MKKLLLILLLTISAIVVTGCRGKTTPTEVEIPELSDQELLDLEADITFWHAMGQENQESLDKLIARFNETYPNISITHETQGDYTTLRSNTIQSVPAGTNPTMLVAYPDHTATYLDSDFALPITDYIEHEQVGLSEDDLADFIPSYLEEGRIYDDEGTYYALPFNKSTEVLFVNKTLLTKYGKTLSATPTWDEIDKIAEAANNDGKIGLNWDSESNLFIVMTEQWGGKYTSLEEDNHYQFDNEKTKEAVNYFISRAKEDNGKITKFATPTKWEANYGSAAFLKQEVVMTIGSTAGAKYNDPAFNDADFEMEIYPMPQKDVNNKKALQQGTNINILSANTSGEERLAAWLFTKFLTTDTEANATFAAESGYLPATKSAYNSSIYQSFLSTTQSDIVAKAKSCKIGYEQSSAYFISPSFVGSSNARDEVAAIIANVIYGGKSLDSEISRALSELNF